MAAPTPTTLSLVCACGRKLRIRNFIPGLQIGCPQCGRALPLPGAARPVDVVTGATTAVSTAPAATSTAPAATNAALTTESAPPNAKSAPPNAESVPSNADRAPRAPELIATASTPPMATAAIREAQPVSPPQLRPAAAGARPGLTGRLTHTHDESLVMTAMTGRPLDAATVASAGLIRGPSAGGAGLATRNFIDDLVGAFCLAGRVANLACLGAYVAISIGAVAIASALMVLPVFPLIFMVLGMAFGALLLTFFCWQVLQSTLSGEDVMPLVEPSWDPWEQSIRPTLLLIGGLAVYGFPALVIHRYVPAEFDPHRAWTLTALALPILLFPLMIALVGNGQALRMLSPVAVTRALARLGRFYPLAWCGAAAALASIGLAIYFRGRFAPVPIFGPLLFTLTFLPTLFYCSFVIFRIAGLLARYMPLGEDENA